MADDPAVLRLCDLEWIDGPYWEQAHLHLKDGTELELQRACREGARCGAGEVKVGSCVASIITNTACSLQFTPEWKSVADELTMQCWLIEYLRDHPRR
jgi:hypothetical protein